MKKIRLINIKLFISIITAATITLAPVSVSALGFNNYFASEASNAACSGLSSLDSSQGCGSGAGSTTVNSVVKTIINILSFVIGLVAVIMIIVAGFKFITSGGDTQKVASAKNTLIYALIGLVIVALAQTIVHFVINESTTSVAPPKHK